MNRLAAMPELPEVETVRRGLQELLRPPCRVARAHCRRPDLRWPLPTDLSQRLTGRRLTAIGRRGKYLLVHCGTLTMLNHLGMTGSWRVLPSDIEPGLHDHVLLDLTDGRRLAFRDPRRFGMIDLASTAHLDEHPRLAGMGPEPLGPDFDGTWLQRVCAGRKAPIKNLLLDQRVVAGIGNIYAAEALYRAGIHPLRAAGRIAVPRLQRLVRELQATLQEAITAGGSTISDFRQAGGEHGWFQHAFRVYGRARQPCASCGAPLRSGVMAGRSTVWCGRCQT